MTFFCFFFYPFFVLFFVFFVMPMSTETIASLDPRIARAALDATSQPASNLEASELFETYEVLHQAKSGGRHTHVGSVHAPNPEIAYLFAKEQYGRRLQTYSIWVVRTADVFTSGGTADSVGDSVGDSTGNEAEETFASATAPEKEYRNAATWKVRDKIDRYKQGLAGVVGDSKNAENVENIENADH
jgi:ring-1,2-phenylacetyl-CoA epoxidase subunit PaaB